MHPQHPFREREPNDGQTRATRHHKAQPLANPHQHNQNLLRAHFHLQVPLDTKRLCPTVPSRLNYLLHLRDLINLGKAATSRHRTSQAADAAADPAAANAANHHPYVVVDVGTGSSCIYALLGAAALGWRFVATELDAAAYEAARANVRRNRLDAEVDVRRVVDAEAPPLLGALRDGECADACLCNPPFYALDEVPLGRLDAGGARCAAATSETHTAGGEVGFVSRLIRDSQRLRGRVGWYTSLVGRKASLRPLVESLRAARVPWVRTCRLDQGETSRWVLAWSYSPAGALACPWGEPPAGAACLRFRVPGSAQAEVLARARDALDTLGGVETHRLEADGPLGASLVRATAVGASGSTAAFSFFVEILPSTHAAEVAPLPLARRVSEHVERSLRAIPVAEDGELDAALGPRVAVALDGLERGPALAAFWRLAERVRADVLRTGRRWRRKRQREGREREAPDEARAGPAGGTFLDAL